MARKNSIAIRKKKHKAMLERAADQQRLLDQRKQRREEAKKEHMEVDQGEEPVKKKLKRKFQRKLDNYVAKLARKGIKLVKVEDDDADMDDGDKRTKRVRASTE